MSAECGLCRKRNEIQQARTSRACAGLKGALRAGALQRLGRSFIFENIVLLPDTLPPATSRPRQPR
jgi:hypothetical protein